MEIRVEADVFADNDELICYSKVIADLSNAILVIVNLDPYHAQTGWVELPLGEFELDTGRPYQLHDLLSDARYLWHGALNFVALEPNVAAARAHGTRLRLLPVRQYR